MGQIIIVLGGCSPRVRLRMGEDSSSGGEKITNSILFRSREAVCDSNHSSATSLAVALLLEMFSFHDLEAQVLEGKRI